MSCEQDTGGAHTDISATPGACLLLGDQTLLPLQQPQLQVPVEGVIDQVPPGLFGGGDNGAKRQALCIQDTGSFHCNRRDRWTLGLSASSPSQRPCQPHEHGLPQPRLSRGAQAASPGADSAPCSPGFSMGTTSKPHGSTRPRFLPCGTSGLWTGASLGLGFSPPSSPGLWSSSRTPQPPPVSPHLSSSLLLSSSSLLCSSCAFPAWAPGSAAAGGGSAAVSSWGTCCFCPFLAALSGEQEPRGEEGLRQSPL